VALGTRSTPWFFPIADLNQSLDKKRNLPCYLPEQVFVNIVEDRDLLSQVIRCDAPRGPFRSKCHQKRIKSLVELVLPTDPATFPVQNDRPGLPARGTESSKDHVGDPYEHHLVAHQSYPKPKLMLVTRPVVPWPHSQHLFE